MKQIIVVSILLLAILLSGVNAVIAANDYELSWDEPLENFDLQSGENWFYIQLSRDDNATYHDIYFEITFSEIYERIYTELYYYNKSDIVANELDDSKSKHCLVYQGASTGYYYLKVYSPFEVTVSITATKFKTARDAEPNNLMSFAEQLNLSTDATISGDLGDENDNDVDFYAYTTTEPCMLRVHLYDDTDAKLSIYSGETLIASSAERPTVKLPYNFNFVHGTCYFKVYGGSGSYTLHITKKPYSARPVLYGKVSNTPLYSELDALNPKIAVLAQDNISVGYTLYKDKTSYVSNPNTITTNENSFTEYQFPTIPASYPQIEASSRCYIVFSAKGTAETEEVFMKLLQDNAPPEYKDVLVEANEDSVEVTVIEAFDTIKLASKPYRYRIYLTGTTPPEYSEWLTKNYYSKGIDTGTGLIAGDYIVEVQVRDQVAENCKNSSQDLSNHILTVTKTVQIS